MAKIISFNTACRLSKKLRKLGKKVIWTSGCFDILHIGHIDFIKRTRSWMGNQSIFMVGVETDTYVQQTKGKNRPIFNQKDRSGVLSGIVYIDMVVLLPKINRSENNYIKRYRKLKPTYVVFGDADKINIKNIRIEAKKAGTKFKQLSNPAKISSTSHIIKVLNKLG